MTTHHAQPEDTTEQDRNPTPPPPPDQPRGGTDAEDAPEIVDEVLIEEVGIDGMCGVY